MRVYLVRPQTPEFSDKLVDRVSKIDGVRRVEKFVENERPPVCENGMRIVVPGITLLILATQTSQVEMALDTAIVVGLLTYECFNCVDYEYHTPGDYYGKQQST